MLVIYEGDGEVLVCTSGKSEKELIKLYFTEGGRNIEEYDRTTFPSVCAIEIHPNVSLDGE